MKTLAARAGALLALAVVGAVAAIAASGGTKKANELPPPPPPPTTTAAPPPPTTTAPPPPPPPPTTTVVTTTPKPPPAKPTGWTIVLQSLPDDARASALASAGRAKQAGLAGVGVLHSSDYRSLRPGFLVVYFGVYRSQADAAGAVRSARDAGFGSAYVREIAR